MTHDEHAAPGPVENLPVVLVHGGLYDDPPMTAGGFWLPTGVVDALVDRDVDVILHERPATPRSWIEERIALEATLREAEVDRAAIVAGSNGCSVALRLALDAPSMVARTLLCWPATAGDSVIDELARVIITETHDAQVATKLLSGRPLRGVTAGELAGLDAEVVIHPSMPESPMHRRSTATELVAALGSALLIGGSPEPVDPGFAPHLAAFADLVLAFSQVMDDD